MRECFRGIHLAVKTILIGLRIGLRYCSARTITSQYANMAPTLRPRIRGFDDRQIEKCLACESRPKACSVDCMSMSEAAPGATKGAMWMSPFDFGRFGSSDFRATPRHSDLMIMAGTATCKIAARVIPFCSQIPDPKYAMAMGARTIGGGPWFQHGYRVVKGVDLIVPVDVYVPGYPPRPEALLQGLMRLQDKTRARTIAREPEAPNVQPPMPLV